VLGHNQSTGAGVSGYSVSGLAGHFVGTVKANFFDNSSDLRLKHDVNESTYGLEAVQSLRPVSYQWNDRDDGVHLGFIAQDVREVIPELVSVSPGADTMLSVNYDGIIPVLVKAIQEQQEQIDALRNAALTPNPSHDFAGEGSTFGTSHQTLAETWAMPGGLAVFGLGLFAVAVALWRRTRVVPL
jgi:hypothetical protein